MRFLPRTFQVEVQQRLLDNPALLVALRMGTGKTAITLLALKELMHERFEISKVLVVAPKRVAELVWHNEAAKWDETKDLRIQRVLGNAAARETALAQAADIYVINRENFSWLVERYAGHWPYDCVVIDENRGFKGRSSKSWQALKSVRDAVKRLYILSGTPTPNSLLELWPQISILDRGKRLGRSLTAYRERWFTPDRRSGHIVYSWALKPGADKEIHRLVADIMVSVESGIALPTRIDTVVAVDFDKTRYHQMRKEMVSQGIVAVSAGVLAGKLAQMANGAVYDEERRVHEIHSAKLDALKTIVEQGEPVLCFTSYQHDQKRILERFPNARVFDGEKALGAWTRGEVALLLMHPASGGHGVDGLQLGGSVAVWFGLPFSLDLYEQANARLHRTGQQHNVIVHHLVAVGTIDEDILQVLSEKGDVQGVLLSAVQRIFGLEKSLGQS